MEGKNVIVGVLILSLVLAQLQVEASLCCPAIYPPIHDCQNLSTQACRKTPGCGIFVGGDVCPKRNSVQVEETKLCCPNTIPARCYKYSPEGTCEKTPGCEMKIVSGNMCPYLGNSVIQVEETKLCCPNTIPARCYKFSPEGTCEKTPGCEIKIVKGNQCPYLGNSGAIISEYCKLGCASTVCNAISTLQISGDEVVNEAVGQCNNACSAFCTEGSTLEIA